MRKGQHGRQARTGRRGHDKRTAGKDKMENPVKIVRYSGPIRFESGVESNMQCLGGTLEEVRKCAEQIAAENHVEVEVIL